MEEENILITEGRKLVTVRTICEINQIPGADNIVEAFVDGWGVVVKKGEFEVGDKCVFFEVDSFLPVEPRFEFLIRNGTKIDEHGVERIRLRSVKLKQTLSQGLALPLHMFPELNDYDIDNLMLECYGIENILNVTKYERPSERNGGAGGFAADAAGDFPWFIAKTDEPRIQNIYGKYSEQYRDIKFQKTLKLDGSSCTVAYITNESLFNLKLDKMKRTFNEELQEVIVELEESYPFTLSASQLLVCSRNRTLKYVEDNNFWKAVEGSGVHNKITEYCIMNSRQLAIQGEVLAPNIQGNPEKVDKAEFYAYRIFDIDNRTALGEKEFNKICKELDIRTVPVLGEEYPFRDYANLKELLAAADIPSMNSAIAEGVVYKSIEPVNGHVLHFKVINNRWLLKVED